MSSGSERAGLLEMCLGYMKQDETLSEKDQSWTDIYKKMWRNRIQEQIELSEVSILELDPLSIDPLPEQNFRLVQIKKKVCRRQF